MNAGRARIVTVLEKLQAGLSSKRQPAPASPRTSTSPTIALADHDDAVDAVEKNLARMKHTTGR
jgi:hypothetical protein